MREFLAFAGALLTVLCVVPYLIDIVRGRSKPNIVTWSTWLLLSSIACAATFATHEYNTAMFVLATVIGNLLIVVFGLRKGIAEYSWFDGVCQALALSGLALWLIFDSPNYGIVIPVMVDLIALLPTIRHAWIRPDEETWLTYFIDVVAPALTLLSLVHFTIASALYPVYLLIANAVVVVVILFRRQRLRAQITVAKA